MRHLKHNRSGTLIENARLINPQRSVLLPPIPAATWIERSPRLVTTKIVVNKGKTNDVGPELIAVGRTVDGIGTSKSTDPLLRISQLEQNIRFLQEQHQQMLTGLHEEIDSLRQRNRDLQFQLVFSKGYVASSSSPSTPEEDQKTRVLSPKQVNVTPLQVELLERELGELKIQLQDVNTRNVYLTAIVDEQKKKLEHYDQEQEKEKPVSLQPDQDLVNKLDDVEVIVRKLRRENDDLRREVGEIRSGNNSGNQNRGRYRGNNHYRGHRFPPLHTQSYWQGGRGVEREGESSSGGTSLPSLNVNQQNNHGGGHYGRRTGNNNHRYHQGGENRKYRGGQSRGHKS